MNQWLDVQEVLWHSEHVFELRLAGHDFPYVPGDCAALFSGDGQASRPYSFASAPHEPVLRFVIRRMPGGEVSPYLAERRPGDRVCISPPFGWFRPGQAIPPSPFVFIATGTGIAPFLAYLGAYPDRPPAALLYGVRLQRDAVYADWIKARSPLRLAVSREDCSGAYRGRVTDLLGDVPVDALHHYYLCGLDAMIDQTTNWLEARGVPTVHIHRECFFNA